MQKDELRRKPDRGSSDADAQTVRRTYKSGKDRVRDVEAVPLSCNVTQECISTTNVATLRFLNELKHFACCWFCCWHLGSYVHTRLPRNVLTRSQTWVVAATMRRLSH